MYKFLYQRQKKFTFSPPSYEHQSQIWKNSARTQLGLSDIEQQSFQTEILERIIYNHYHFLTFITYEMSLKKRKSDRRDISVYKINQENPWILLVDSVRWDMIMRVLNNLKLIKNSTKKISWILQHFFHIIRVFNKSFKWNLTHDWWSRDRS
jgi:hypothetical protein